MPPGTPCAAILRAVWWRTPLKTKVVGKEGFVWLPSLLMPSRSHGPPGGSDGKSHMQKTQFDPGQGRAPQINWITSQSTGRPERQNFGKAESRESSDYGRRICLEVGEMAGKYLDSRSLSQLFSDVRRAFSGLIIPVNRASYLHRTPVLCWSWAWNKFSPGQVN